MKQQGQAQTKAMRTASEAQACLRSVADAARVPDLQRFFKTGPGGYAEGDRFLGATVPQVRQLVRWCDELPLAEVKPLVRSAYHEERLLGLLILVRRYQRGSEALREKVYRLYVSHLRWINNWDLIDVTAEHVVGAWLWERDRGFLHECARSRNLWKRRVAILATFHFIKRQQYEDTLRLAKVLLQDEHDLIHKAVGWMLREIGNRDRAVEEAFLREHYRTMPRTMLRYAIEKFPEARRQAYLRGRVE